MMIILHNTKLLTMLDDDHYT